MSKPPFLLTRKIPLNIIRSTQGSYVNGVWVEGSETTVPLEVNIQPMKDDEILLLPEADRTREWYKLYCADEIRTLKEGAGGHAADEFVYKGDRYKVMKVKFYDMGVLDHWRASAVRIETTAQ